MAESRKVAAILVADIVGYSRLVEADEEGTLARLRTLRRDFIDPAIASHAGRLVKRLGDGAIVEFRSVVEAVRCAMEVRKGLNERNAGLPEKQRIEVRVGVHLGDVVEEPDGDLMGDGVNIAARLQEICQPGAICLSEDAYRQVRDRIDEPFVDLGERSLKNIVRPMRAYALVGATGGRPAVVLTTSPEQGRRPSAAAAILENIVLPSIVQESRSRRERRAAMRAGVSAILQNVARQKGADVAKWTPGAQAAFPTVSKRPRRRRLLWLLLAAIFAMLASKSWRGQESFAPPPPAPPPSGALDALERLQRLPSSPSPPPPAAK